LILPVHGENGITGLGSRASLPYAFLAKASSSYWTFPDQLYIPLDTSRAHKATCPS
jgi:hypothetical protein